MQRKAWGCDVGDGRHRVVTDFGFCFVGYFGDLLNGHSLMRGGVEEAGKPFDETGVSFGAQIGGGKGPGQEAMLAKMGSGMSPCAACKLLRRRCARDCVFAPYFPPDEPQKFASVHKVFGAANVNKMLQDLPVHQRGDAVSSMVYEADARVRDPVYGCVSAISSLQQQIALLQNQLAVANAEIVCMRMHQAASNAASLKSSPQATPPEMSPPLQPRSPELQHYKPATKASEKGEALWT